MHIRQDGLSNALTGIGGIQDRTRGNQYLASPIRLDQELTDIWTSNGLGKKVCSLQIDDMIRPWIEVPDDPEGKLVKALDELNVRDSLQRALYWTDLYRGAVVVMILGDGSLDLKEPLRESKGNPAPLKALRVYPATRNRILSNTTDIVTDTSSPYFGDLETYKIQPPDSAGIFEAHATRCIVSKGVPMPPDELIPWEYQFWGVSRLQAIFDDLTSYNVTVNAFSNLIHMATIGKLKIQNLGEIVADDDTASDRLKGVMDNVARSISYLNMILMGEGDEFSRDQLSLSGWKEVAQMFRENLAAVAGYSTSVLFETATSSGLSASTSEDQATQRYYNGVDVRRETDLRTMLSRIIHHVAPMVGLKPDISWKFRNLHEPSAKEIADIRKVQADTAKIYLDEGVLFPQEVRSRFEGGNYSDEITLDPSYAAKGPDELDAEKELEAATAAAAQANQTPQTTKPLQMPTPPKTTGKAKK